MILVRVVNQPMSPFLLGNVAVIASRSSSIGLAVAQELHAHGMRLVLNARSEERLIPLQEKLKPSPGCIPILQTPHCATRSVTPVQTGIHRYLASV